MKTNDDQCIYESYREDILKKFKESLHEKEPEVEEEPSSSIEKKEMEDVDHNIEDDSESDVDDESNIESPKKKVVVKSEEFSVNVGPKIRAILRNFPSMVEDKEVLSELKKAIERANSELSSEDEITQSPLKIYDKLIELGIISEEEMDEEEFEEKEAEVLQNFDDDDYTEDDNAYDAEMRKDIEKGKAEEMIRQMGTDWRKHDEDFYSSNY